MLRRHKKERRGLEKCHHKLKAVAERNGGSIKGTVSQGVKHGCSGALFKQT